MRKIVVIGGGFTGSKCARVLEKDKRFEVFLIDNKSYFEFTPSVLRTILEPEHEKKIQIDHKDYLKKARVFVDEVVEVSDKYVKTKKKKFEFDYLIIASGSDYADPIKEPEVVSVNRAKKLKEAHEELNESKKVLIIGGGLVGVELAAEICTHYKDKEIVIVHSHSELIERNHPKARKYVKNFLNKHGVKIILGERVEKKKDGFFVTNKKTKLKTNSCFMTVGIKPNYDFMRKKFGRLLDERNFVEVNEFLQVNDFKNVFAGGDITGIKEEKTAQTAERHADVIIQNVKRLEDKKELIKYAPKKRPMIISLGKHDGVFDNGKIAFSGVIPAIMKWFVEWKTMRKYR